MSPSPPIVAPDRVYSTFLGGTASDVGNAIVVDDDGKAAYVTGSTDSGEYRTTTGAHDSSYNGGGDAFVTKLEPSRDYEDADDDHDD